MRPALERLRPLYRWGKNGRWRMTTTAARPAIKIVRATANWTHKGTLSAAYFFSSHPVPGHAEKPENNANQPLVSGQGPS